MGIDQNSLALYCQFANRGLFNDIQHVMELGSQNIVGQEGNDGEIATLIGLMGQEIPPAHALKKLANNGKARALYEALGFSYACIDSDGSGDAITLDLNFDSAPPDFVGKYQFVTNHGTTEHVFDQRNAFKVMHDFTAVGGLMYHVVPMQGGNFLNHCFYMYEPDFFISLAKNNGYEILGMWGIFQDKNSFIQWDGSVADASKFRDKYHQCIGILLRKNYNYEFMIPYQTKYESTQNPSNSARYNYVVDGKILNGLDMKRLKMPRMIKKFPADLYIPLVNHTGWYLDGWVEQKSSIYLPGGVADTLTIRGLVPLIDNPDHQTKLTVIVNGQSLAARSLRLGEWNMSLPIPASKEPRRINLIFSTSQNLPAPENRSVSALIKELGLIHPR